jgi:hypothetical protein
LAGSGNKENALWPGHLVAAVDWVNQRRTGFKVRAGSGQMPPISTDGELGFADGW